MIIFLRNIPENTKYSDILTFIEPAMRVTWLRKKGMIEGIKIKQLKHLRTNLSEFHGLVTIEPDAMAEKVIKRLNRKFFLGKYIAVRKYRQRDWHNDPRRAHKQLSPSILERRQADRRRDDLELIEGVSSKFTSSKVFYKRY